MLAQYTYVMTVKVNGINEINLTKLDVLTGFESIKVGTKYLCDGVEVKGMPASLRLYSKVEVEYELLPGWKEDISKCRSFDELPDNCKAYVARVQELLDVPIRWVTTVLLPACTHHDIIYSRVQMFFTQSN